MHCRSNFTSLSEHPWQRSWSRAPRPSARSQPPLHLRQRGAQSSGRGQASRTCCKSARG